MEMEKDKEKEMKWNGADAQMEFGFKERFNVLPIVHHVKSSFFAEE